VIHGTQDQTVPIDASARAALPGLAHGALIEYDGAPHGLFATDKARLTRDLLNFLAH
jgi:pimeloyl-ACP methyl ester carboxylesterase